MMDNSTEQILQDSQYIFLDQSKKYVFILATQDGYRLPSNQSQLDEIKSSFVDALAQIGFGENQIAIAFMDGIEVLNIIEVSENDS